MRMPAGVMVQAEQKEASESMPQCTHTDQIHDVNAAIPSGCEECLKMGDTWVHLRLCLLLRTRGLLRQF